jgi:hypothetical protein
MTLREELESGTLRLNLDSDNLEQSLLSNDLFIRSNTARWRT